MTSEEERMFQLNYIRPEFGIMRQSCLKYFDFNFCLPVELRLVPYYFQSYHLLFLMIKGLKHQTKGSVTKSTDNFIAVCDRISSCYSGFALFVGEIFQGMNSSFANVKNLVPEDFFFFKGCQKGILLFFLTLLHLDCVTSLVG